MTNDLDQHGWESRWERALQEHGDMVAKRPPNAYLTELAAGLSPGRALDAGCGHGAEAIWLAACGWQVTAVDFSAKALEFGRATASALGTDIAERVEWVEGDHGVWAPASEKFDLVSCLYVHVAGSVEEMIGQLASGVAPGGTLLLVGHRPVDPATGQPTPAAGQVQVSVEEATAVLSGDAWELAVAEERERSIAGSGVDAVIVATRRP